MSQPYTPADLQARKAAIRAEVHSRRQAQTDKDELSRRICDTFMSLAEYAAAQKVLFYLDARSEVRTRHSLPAALASGKTIVVPWCNEQQELELFHLEALDELAVGMYRILEPRPELRRLPNKVCQPEELDLAMVPGVAFDERLARMGHGFGYYDKLLHRLRPGVKRVALAFECQIFPEIPTQEHDVFMDLIITERRILSR
jgi:5-formyltetrahydrofolate cyclo-ligase